MWIGNLWIKLRVQCAPQLHHSTAPNKQISQCSRPPELNAIHHSSYAKFLNFPKCHLRGIPHSWSSSVRSAARQMAAPTHCYHTNTPPFHSLVNENQTNHQSKRQMCTVVVHNFNLQSVRQRLLPVSSAAFIVGTGFGCAFRQLKLSAIAQNNVSHKCNGSHGQSNMNCYYSAKKIAKLQTFRVLASERRFLASKRLRI